MCAGSPNTLSAELRKIFRLKKKSIIPTKEQNASATQTKKGLGERFLVRVQSEEFLHRLQKLLRWLLFGVVVGFLPFAYPAIKSIVVGPPPTLSSIFGRGDLFLVTATLVAASFGDLIASGKERAIRKITAGFFCLFIFIICIVWFGVVASSLDDHTKYNALLTSKDSLWLFGFAVLICAGSVILADDLKPSKTEDNHHG